MEAQCSFLFEDFFPCVYGFCVCSLGKYLFSSLTYLVGLFALLVISICLEFEPPLHKSPQRFSPILQIVSYACSLLLWLYLKKLQKLTNGIVSS